MKRLILLAALSLTACGGVAPPGETGTSGGTTGTSTQCLCNNDPPDSGVNCTPGAAFCDGSQVWTCTKSGHDASLTQDCALSGSATNPGICAEVASGAQCVREYRPCTADITAPSAADPECTFYWAAPTACTDYATFSVTVTPSQSCSALSGIIVGSTRTHAVGDTITLPDQSITVELGGALCRSGTVQWTQDAPDPQFVVHATCDLGNFDGTVTGKL